MMLGQVAKGHELRGKSPWIQTCVFCTGDDKSSLNLETCGLSLDGSPGETLCEPSTAPAVPTREGGADRESFPAGALDPRTRVAPPGLTPVTPRPQMMPTCYASTRVAAAPRS